MRFRGLALFPLVYAAVFAAVAWLLLDAAALGSFIIGQRLILRVLAIVGCVAAATVFERGEHLRRAWWLLGFAAILIFLRDLSNLPPIELGESAPELGPLVIQALGVGSNLASLAGLALLAFTWKKASVVLPGGRYRVVLVVLVTLAAVLLALLLAGRPAVEQAERLADGDEGALILLVSAVVDILSLCLLAPLLLTAMALKGGTIGWPWALLSASILSWLLYDWAVFHAPTGEFPLTEVFRDMAVGYLFAAGMAQRFAVTRARN